MIRRAYVDAGWGQVHYREAGAGPHPALVCLHATAYSSRSLLPLLPPLAVERRVIALDTPGYGASDGPAEPVPFTAYADAIGEAVAQLEADRPVDIFGYHTGAMIGVDLAVRRPALVRRLVLIGVPYFTGADHAEWRARLVHPTSLTEDFDQFRSRWEYLVARRASGFSLARGLDNFADELTVYPREWFAHGALFGFASGDCLRQVRQKALVINPDSALAPASRAAAALMADASVQELPDVTGAIFDTAAGTLAALISAFCSG